MPGRPQVSHTGPLQSTFAGVIVSVCEGGTKAQNKVRHSKQLPRVTETSTSKHAGFASLPGHVPFVAAVAAGPVTVPSSLLRWDLIRRKRVEVGRHAGRV